MGDVNLDLDLRLFSDSELSDKEDDGSNTDEDSDKEHNANMTRLCAALLVRRLKRRKQQPKTRPTTVEECNVVAHGWAKLSGPSESRSLFTTVIGMI
jgi:hypothetical protein